MDLKDQLKNLFPDHKVSEEPQETEDKGLWIPDDAVECHFEKRNGKPHTIIKGYTGNKDDFKQLAKDIKKMLGVGGSSKNEEIIIQGDYRKQIMDYLKELGMKVKRVGG
ncbi:translation initiation factor [Weeksellaceae bacterium TAE3-ERU29]|nr:translation initiation factor [Weeksellaceae bacterium TAE3-ERU29]